STPPLHDALPISFTTHATPATAKAGVHSSLRGRGDTRLPRINTAAGTPHRSHATLLCVKSFSVQPWGMSTLGQTVRAAGDPIPLPGAPLPRVHGPRSSPPASRR